MRPIDADELLKNYQTICSSIRCYDCQFNGEWGDKGCQLEAMINNAPTIDSARHGHWVDMGDFEQCSVCHGTHLKEFQSYYGKTTWIKTHYCHNCGAKMDEGYPNALNALDTLEDEDEI